MATRLSEPAIQELSVVFGNFDGKEYAPRNEEARVLSVKGAEKGLVSKAVEALKAYFSTSNDLVDVQPYPVTQADDDIDNDGDGPEDYNQIVSALCAVYGDISQACSMQDDGARSAAIVTAIQSFLLGLDALREGDAEKAGARHSAADQAHIEALQAAHAKAKKAVDSMGDHLSALQPAAKAGEKPYGDVAYADPKNGKYPIDTEEHARAAWSYINQDKNAAEYSAAELAEVKDKIRAACEKFGIDISKAAEITQPMENDMTQDEINALVADAASKAAEAAVAKANEAAQVKIDAAKAEADVAKAAAEKARLDAEADAQAKLAEANSALEAAKAAEKVAADEAAALKAAAVKTARTPSGGSTQTEVASSSLQAAVKAALAGATSSVL